MLPSKFCKLCGAPFGEAQTFSQAVAAPPPKDLAQGVGEAGKRIGGEMGWMGERFGKNISDWWDKSLGILSPIVIGFFGLVLILFGWFVADIVASRSDAPQFWEELANFVVDNFLLLAGLMFVGAFHTYFHRRYRGTYRWIAPAVTAVMVTAWAWVLAQVLILAGRHSEHPGFKDAGEILEALLIAVFIIGVLVGYAILWFSLVSPANWDRAERRS